MKTLLLVAGSVGLLASPAIAGSKGRVSKRPTTVASVETSSADSPSPAAAAAPELALPAEVIAIPDLPADTRSALVPFPELELAARPVAARPAASTRMKQKAPVMRMGTGYVVGGGKREATGPSQEVERIIPKSLSQSQVATVVQAHMSDIQNCWNLVPRAHRADACTVDLKLSIAEGGAVTDIELGGDVPAAAHKCITSAVSRWTFPVAETSSDVEYGVSLRSL